MSNLPLRHGAKAHIVFTQSGAVDLREALAIVGIEDTVLVLTDCLAHGPINPPDLTSRQAFIEHVLGYSGYEEFASDREDFWRLSLDKGVEHVVWVSRNSTQEYCGFLEWLYRFGSASFDLIDLTDVSYPKVPGNFRRDKIQATGLLRAEEFVEMRLWESAEAIDVDQQSRWQALWEDLRRENAPLRILTSDGLVSAPLDVFDEELLSYVSHEWCVARRIVGLFLAYNAEATGFFQVSDMILFSRIDALVLSGRLQAEGNRSDLKHFKVRLTD